MVAVGACDDGPVYEYARDVTFRVYAPGDGEETGTVVYDGQAQQDTLVQIERQGKQYRVDVTGDKPCRVILVNAGSRAKVSGAAWEVRGKDIILAFEKSGMAQVEAEAFSGMS